MNIPPRPRPRETNTPPPPRKVPALTRLVGVCTGCHHWQIDFGTRAAREYGTADRAFQAVALAHHDHLYGECVGGTEGRIKVDGVWVDRPTMEDGNPAAGVVQFTELPRWWVTR